MEAASSEDAPSTFLGTLLGLFASPSKAMQGIAKAPSVWLPLLGLIALNLAFTAVWVNKMDPRDFMRAQIDETPRLAKLPAEQQQAVIEAQSKILRPIAWVGAVLGSPIVVSIVALFVVFVFRFVLGDDTTLRQGFAIIAWSYLTTALVQLPLILLILTLKADWNIPPQEVFQAGPAIFLDKQSTSKALFAFLGCLDLFSLWNIALMAWGFAAAAKRRFGSAVMAVAAPWVVYVAGKVVLAWINS